MKHGVVVATALLALAVVASQPVRAHDAHTKTIPAQEMNQLVKEGVYTGEFTIMGNGTARSWIRYNKAGKPESVGVTFSETALTGLPTPPAKMHDPSFCYDLALPTEGKVTGYDHISFDWNPLGHEPKGVYDVPHFDVHFYQMATADLNKITATGADLAICRKAPAAAYIPQGYIMPPGVAVPHMGNHAVDATSPELHGKPFTSTFIYGFYNGQMRFVEPMVALSYLQSKTDYAVPVRVPTAYARSGYYPTRYSVSYDKVRQEYSISLDGLVWRQGGMPPASGVKRVALRTGAPQK